jgi:hypothetical protein
MLFVHDGSDNQTAGGGAALLRHDARRIDHRRHAALHVLRSAAIETAVALNRRERLAHAGHTDGVGMPAEHQRRTFHPRLEHTDDVRPSAAGVFDGDLESDAAHRGGNRIGNLAFAGGTGHQRRIDGVDGNQIAQQFDGWVHVVTLMLSSLRHGDQAGHRHRARRSRRRRTSAESSAAGCATGS